MGFYFPIVLFMLTVFTGIVSLFSLFLSQAERAQNQDYLPYKGMKLCREFFWVFFIVLIIRSFIVQPYIVPTGSLEPTILPGDLLLANEFYYGLRMPVWQFKLIPILTPKHGQIMLFRDPVNPKNMLIKRVIGLPGDKISYVNKVLYINGKEMRQKLIGKAEDVEPGYHASVEKYQENLEGVVHDIYRNPQIPAVNFYNVVVPKGHYFAMGDNRDDSDDSRYWGFVPSGDIVGKAGVIFMSWNSNASSLSHKIRWHRIGTLL